MLDVPQFSLIKHLEKHAPLICDGAKSLVLHNLGVPQTEMCFVANLTHPQLVVQMYKSYLQAGASILRTNTDGANFLALDALELNGRGENINNNGMALIREGAGMAGIPAGSVISTKKYVTGDIPHHILEKAYGEQFIYLADTGAKFVMLGDFNSLDELLLATRVAKRTIQKQTVVHWTIEEPEERDIIKGMQALLKQGADFVGIQASSKLEKLPQITKKLVSEFGVVSVLLDEPIALPFGNVSSDFLSMTEKLLDSEVAIIGGGNHTTPAHIKEINHIMKRIFAE